MTPREKALRDKVVRAAKPCRCRIFCLEDVERTGRICKLRELQAALAAHRRKHAK